MFLKKYLKVIDLRAINNVNENHNPWLPKYFVVYMDKIIKEATEIIIPFLMSCVWEAPINIPSSW